MERVVGKRITWRCIIEEETEELNEKSLHNPPSQNDSLVNKLEYMDTKKTFQT